MAEGQQSHRFGLETKKVNASGRDSFLGICSAFIISILAILASAYIILKLNSIPAAIGASVLSGSVIVGIVSMFINGTRRQK
jgi:uncharacterized membrane protein